MPDGSVPTRPSRGLLTYQPELEEEIFEFQREAYPRRRPDWIAPRWRWMFVRAAERLGVPPMVWVYRNKEAKLVAHQGAIPVRLQIDGHERVTGWFVETMALASARGGPIGPSVVARARQDLPMNLSLGQTPQMRALQFSLGWQQVCPLETYVYVVDAATFAAAKIRNPVRRIGVRVALVVARTARRLLRRRQRVSVAPIEAFDRAHDELWQRVQPAYRACVVRDASYLNWKYVEQPGQQFHRLEVRRGGVLESVVVLSALPADEAYAYPRALLVDLVVDPRNPAAVDALFEAARRFCVTQRLATIVFDVISPALALAARRFGFLTREAERFLLISAGDLAEPARTTLTDPASWLVTRGDSDIDRPW